MCLLVRTCLLECVCLSVRAVGGMLTSAWVVLNTFCILQTSACGMLPGHAFIVCLNVCVWVRGVCVCGSQHVSCVCLHRACTRLHVCACVYAHCAHACEHLLRLCNTLREREHPLRASVAHASQPTPHHTPTCSYCASTRRRLVDHHYRVTGADGQAGRGVGLELRVCPHEQKGLCVCVCSVWQTND